MYGGLQVAAGVAAQVDAESLEALLCQFSQSYQQFRIRVLAEILDADVARLVVQHVGGRDAARRYLAARDGDVAQLLFTIAQNAQLDLRILRTLQAVHGLFVGQCLAGKRLVVDGYYLVAGNDAGTLGRHVERVLTYGELNAYTGERAAQVVVGLLDILGRDIDRVRVQLGQYLWHGLLDEVIDIDGVNILVVDDVQQVVQLVTTAVDDAQAVA